MLACVGLLLSWLVAPTGAAAAPPLTPDDQANVPPVGAPIDGPAHQLARNVKEVAARGYADIFAGMSLDEASRRVVLYVTDPARGAVLAEAGAARLLSADRAQTGVEIRVSRYSFAQLEAARAQLWDVAKAWKKSGVDVYMIAIPFDGSAVQVATNKPDVAAAMLRTDGTTIFSGGVSSSDVQFELGSPAEPLSRAVDTPPYNGGAHLNLADGRANCTAGFGMDVPGFGRRLVTASHCWDVGEPVFNGGREIGRVQSLGAYRDAEFIDAPGITVAWSGVFTNGDGGDYRHYAWGEDSFANWEVCQSGRVTFYRCGIFVTRNAEWDTRWGHTVGLEGCRRDGAPFGEGGDSGGPIFSWIPDGRVISRGIVSARWRDAPHCGLWPQTLAILSFWNARLLSR